MMTKLLLLGFFICFLLFPFVRCFIFNIPNALIYICYDAAMYVYGKKWTLFGDYGIDMFIGMFGHGKTLSMTHKAQRLYDKFGNSLLFVSNYKLNNIPYVPLVNFNQLLELGEEKPPYYSKEEIKNGAVPSWYLNEKGKVKMEYIDDVEETYIDEESGEERTRLVHKVKRWNYQGTVVLIDEIQSVLSHRNYALFPLELLNTLTQQRKKHVYIMCTAQRFFMVDKIWRSITTNAIDCTKYWRFQNMKYFDAWDYEQAVNSQLVKSKLSYWWFVKNKDFGTYDTEQMISRTMSEDFISNDERLARLGLDNVVNEQAIRKPSNILKKARKTARRR